MTGHIIIGKQIPSSLTDKIVGCDVAAYNLLKKGYKDIIAIGDFDSCTKEEYDYIKNNCKEIYEYSAEKDETDLSIAIDYLLTQNIENIVIHFEVQSGRIDHLLGNILLLKKGIPKGIPIQIETMQNYIYILLPGEYQISSFHKKYISLFALENINSLTLKGFKYDLNNYKLNVTDTLCISNEVISEDASLNFDQGLMLVIHADD